ncbi:MAG: DUF2726 domain-containing protein [Planctomycetaceae bacterium]|nr:DUF2726 domain-containing protein [Planctomycetaceae bacterium]
MLDALAKTTISEVILLFLLLFVLPMLALLVKRLRKYEMLYGVLKEEGRKKKKKKADEPEPAAPPPEILPEDEPPPDNSYPYASRIFLSPADKACLSALKEAFGSDVDIFPKVALWEVVEPTEKAVGYANRLRGLLFDFLICDAKTGQVLTGIAYNPGKGRPAGPIDELKAICHAAGANLVFIDMAEEYDATKLKDALGIPDLDI